MGHKYRCLLRLSNFFKQERTATETQNSYSVAWTLETSNVDCQSFYPSLAGDIPRKIETTVSKLLLVIPDTKGSEFKVTQLIKQDNEQDHTIQHSHDKNMQAEVSHLKFGDNEKNQDEFGVSSVRVNPEVNDLIFDEASKLQYHNAMNISNKGSTVNEESSYDGKYIGPSCT